MTEVRSYGAVGVLGDRPPTFAFGHKAPLDQCAQSAAPEIVLTMRFLENEVLDLPFNLDGKNS
jgi:hypothetical protein